MEVYIFQGNDGEKVPKTVERLLVKHGVQVLPHNLCEDCSHLLQVTLPNGLTKIGLNAFLYCNSLLEINVCNSVQHIGKEAFESCLKLTKVEFEVSTTSPHELKTIEDGAFCYCNSLPRIKLPSSVTTVGRHAFDACLVLVEANLSTTGVTEISDHAFSFCSSLQTVSLPNTVERIRDLAFGHCSELVTVVVPLDSQSIRVGRWSFHNCRRLSNLVLPKDSTAHEKSFYTSCELLREHYGEDFRLVVAGLIGRFEHFSIHRMCYDHKAVTMQELRQCITDQREDGSLVDEFGMTPFHVFFSTIEPSIELLEVLLDSLPNQILNCKDANGRRPLDYLINNWTDETKSLLQRTLQKWMIERVARWGAMSWMKAMRRKAKEILAEDGKERRETLLQNVYSSLEHYENIQASSMLEMALWKGKLKSGWTTDGTKRQALDREECRCLSGSDVVIPNVWKFLGG